MKVLLVNKFHYVKGGSETYYFGLGELLKKKGIDVIYFSMADERNFLCEQSGYFVDNVDFNAEMTKGQMLKSAVKMLYSFEAKKKFDKLLEDEKPDLIHLNIFQSQLTGSIVDAAKKRGIPMVYTAHDLKSVCPNYLMLNHGDVCEKCVGGKFLNCAKTSCMKDSKLKSILAAAEAYVYKFRKTYKKIDYVITPSAFYKKKIDEARFFDCPVEYMANFLPEGTEYAESFNAGEYFLYFGRLSREKGTVTLLEAYAKLNTKRMLYIVGTGPVEDDLKKIIEEKGLGDRAKLLGFKSGDELKKIVSEARCVILPSEWYENGPYTVMEAMAAGKVVIVSEYGGLPELAEDNVTGFVAKAKNADSLAEKLAAADELPDEEIAAMGRKAAEKAKEMFDAEDYAERIIEVYKRVIK